MILCHNSRRVLEIIQHYLINCSILKNNKPLVLLIESKYRLIGKSTIIQHISNSKLFHNIFTNINSITQKQLTSTSIIIIDNINNINNNFIENVKRTDNTAPLVLLLISNNIPSKNEVNCLRIKYKLMNKNNITQFLIKYNELFINTSYYEKEIIKYLELLPENIKISINTLTNTLIYCLHNFRNTLQRILTENNKTYSFIIVANEENNNNIENNNKIQTIENIIDISRIQLLTDICSVCRIPLSPLQSINCDKCKLLFDRKCKRCNQFIPFVLAEFQIEFCDDCDDNYDCEVCDNCGCYLSELNLV